MKKAYLVLSILGAVIPYIFFGKFFLKEGLDLLLFIDSLFLNGAAGGFSADLLISSFVFWIFLFQTKWHRPWPFIILNLTIGLSCALPLYLYYANKEFIKD